MSSTFKAARNNAYNMSWVVGAEHTPDKELEDGNTLKTLRQRSRQLIKDNVFAAGIQQALLNMVGILNTIRIEAPTELLRKNTQVIIDSFIKDASIDNKTLAEVLEENVTSKISDGDVLINLPMDSKRTGVKTVVEVIEANRISTPSDLKRDDNIRHGVEYDADGRVLGYYVKKFNKVNRYGDTRNNYLYFSRVVESDGVERVVTRLFKAPLN